MFGSEFEPTLPHQHVTPIDLNALYEPAGYTFPELAFAIYSFSLPGFTGEQNLVLDWENEWSVSNDPMNFYVALANWEAGTWHVIPMDNEHTLAIEMIEPFIREADDACYVAPVFLGEFKDGLDLISIGFGSAPVITAVEPLELVEGVPAIMSATVGGTRPFNFAWSFGNATTPQTSTDPAPAIVPGNPGVYSCSLKVENVVGEHTYNFDLVVTKVVNTWDHTFGNAINQIPVGCDMNSAGNLVIADEGNTIAIVSPSGQPLASSGYAVTEPDATAYETSGFAIDGSDNVYLCGSYGPVRDYEGVYVMKFAAGTLENQWVKIWDYEQPEPGDRDVATAIAADAAGNTYVTGYTESWGGFYFSTFLLKFDTDGNLLWQRCWGTELVDYTVAVKLFGDNVYVAGYRHDFANPPSAQSWESFILSYSTDGVLGTVRGLDCHDAADLVIDSSGNFYVPGATGSGEALYKLSPTLDLVWCRKLDYDHYFAIYSVVINDGVVHCLASCDNGEILAKRHGVVLSLGTDGSLLGGQVWGSLEDRNSYMFCGTPSGDGDVYLCGSAMDITGGWTDVSGEVTIEPYSPTVYALNGNEYPVSQPATDGAGLHYGSTIVKDDGGGGSDFLVSKRD